MSDSEQLFNKKKVKYSLLLEDPGVSTQHNLRSCMGRSGQGIGRVHSRTGAHAFSGLSGWYAWGSPAKSGLIKPKEQGFGKLYGASYLWGAQRKCPGR